MHMTADLKAGCGTSMALLQNTYQTTLVGDDVLKSSLVSYLQISC